MRQDARPDADSEEQTRHERRCLVSGELHPREGLIRFVLSPDGIVTADFDETLPGRGFWLTARREILQQAAKRTPFTRASKGQAKPLPPDWLDQTEALLRQKCRDWLGLARRAGIAVYGFDKVQQTLRQAKNAGKAWLWLEAAEASPAESRRLARGAGMADSLADQPCRTLTSADLSMALGLEHTAHVALTAHGLTERLRRDLIRLQGIQGEALRGASFAGEINATSTPDNTDVT